MISANPNHGVEIDAANVPDRRATGNILQRNLIGVGLDGTPLGNARVGVQVRRGASENVIGTTGTDPTSDVEGNVIAYNAQQGVEVVDAISVGNSIRGNSIHSNGGIGIDLGGDGVTPKRPRRSERDPPIPPDTDGGPNLLQNFPILSTARTTTGHARQRPNP